MKNYKLIYNSTGKLQEPIEESEFYVAQQEEGSVAFTATFPAFLVGKVKAYIEFKGGGEIIECGDINLNSNSVTLTLSSSDYLIYNFLKVGFEVVTSTAQIRFQPVQIEVDEFVNVTGTGTKQAYTVSVKVGTVTPLENGEAPYVENVGTGKDVVLNFGLPKMDVDSVLSNESTNPVQNRVVSDVLAGKADITWIEPKNFQESVFFYEKLDALTQEGVYGLRNGGFWYHTDYNGTPTGEVTFEPNATSYVIVTTNETIMRQLLLDAEQGMKLRSGTILQDGTVTWEEWEQHATKNELSQKADITWIDIEASPSNTKELYVYPELDSITDDGFYGIRPYEVVYGGEDGNEEIHLPLYTEYLMVSTRGDYDVKYDITQMYLDSEQGLRVRHGKRQSKGSIAWEEWNKQFDFDYVDRTTDQEIDGHKAFFGGISVSRLSGANVDLDINGADSLNLSCDNGDVVIAAKDGDGEVKVIGALNANAVEALGIRAKNQVIAEGGVITNRISVEGGDLTFATPNGELMFSELLNTLRELTERVAALEAVNQDLENIIEMQENYIGGDEA